MRHKIRPVSLCLLPLLALGCNPHDGQVDTLDSKVTQYAERVQALRSTVDFEKNIEDPKQSVLFESLYQTTSLRERIEGDGSYKFYHKLCFYADQTLPMVDKLEELIQEGEALLVPEEGEELPAEFVASVKERIAYVHMMRADINMLHAYAILSMVPPDAGELAYRLIQSQLVLGAIDRTRLAEASIPKGMAEVVDVLEKGSDYGLTDLTAELQQRRQVQAEKVSELKTLRTSSVDYRAKADAHYQAEMDCFARSRTVTPEEKYALIAQASRERMEAEKAEAMVRASNLDGDALEMRVNTEQENLDRLDALLRVLQDEVDFRLAQEKAAEQMLGKLSTERDDLYSKFLAVLKSFDEDYTRTVSDRYQTAVEALDKSYVDLEKCASYGRADLANSALLRADLIMAEIQTLRALRAAENRNYMQPIVDHEKKLMGNKVDPFATGLLESFKVRVAPAREAAQEALGKASTTLGNYQPRIEEERAYMPKIRAKIDALQDLLARPEVQ